METILKTISEITYISVDDILKKKSRVKDIVDARSILSFELKNRIGYSNNKIAEFIGKDRTTVVNLLKRYENLRSYPSDFLKMSNLISKKLDEVL
jgi:chromosomal replication initiation ATPase DnaA